MKAFVYNKKTNKPVVVIQDVVRIEAYKNEILFVTESGERLAFDTKEVKTTTYQN